jgi:hypothetical protein
MAIAAIVVGFLVSLVGGPTLLDHLIGHRLPGCQRITRILG